MTNPFTSNIYAQTWLKHFKNLIAEKKFNSVEGVSFYKSKFLPLYINVGKNLTKGVDYSFDYTASDYKGNVFLIYDVPDYFETEKLETSRTNLKLKEVFQYEGFLMNISAYDDCEAYINAQFSSKNRREFRSNQRRLETCFNIRYSFIHGVISQNEFDAVFSDFYDLLEKRFSEKQTNYHHLSPVKWNYYKELVFKMLQEKKASLLIIYNDKTPIGITLNFHSEDIVFEAITAFDPDYYKFSVGKLSIIKLLEWCFANNYKISDFSKGDFDYKHKWGNVKYDFNYHILYDSKSFIATGIAKFLESKLKLKLYLRQKNMNMLYRKAQFLFKSKTIQNSEMSFKVEKTDSFVPSSKDLLVNPNDSNYHFLRKFLFTFLFANPEPVNNVKIYKISDEECYVILGSKKAQKINFGF